MGEREREKINELGQFEILIQIRFLRGVSKTTFHICLSACFQFFIHKIDENFIQLLLLSLRSTHPDYTCNVLKMQLSDKVVQRDLVKHENMNVQFIILLFSCQQAATRST